MTQDALLNLITALTEQAPMELSPLSAGILAASALGVAHDSRHLSRELGIAHALVLRECNALCDELELLSVDTLDERTQRQFYRLTPQGEALIAQVAPA